MMFKCIRRSLVFFNYLLSRYSVVIVGAYTQESGLCDELLVLDMKRTCLPIQKPCNPRPCIFILSKCISHSSFMRKTHRAIELSRARVLQTFPTRRKKNKRRTGRDVKTTATCFRVVM